MSRQYQVESLKAEEGEKRLKSLEVRGEGGMGQYLEEGEGERGQYLEQGGGREGAVFRRR